MTRLSYETSNENDKKNRFQIVILLNRFRRKKMFMLILRLFYCATHFFNVWSTLFVLLCEFKWWIFILKIQNIKLLNFSKCLPWIDCWNSCFWDHFWSWIGMEIMEMALTLPCTIIYEILCLLFGIFAQFLVQSPNLQNDLRFMLTQKHTKTDFTHKWRLKDKCQSIHSIRHTVYNET